MGLSSSRQRRTCSRSCDCQYLARSRPRRQGQPRSRSQVQRRACWRRSDTIRPASTRSASVPVSRPTPSRWPWSSSSSRAKSLHCPAAPTSGCADSPGRDAARSPPARAAARISLEAFLVRLPVLAYHSPPPRPGSSSPSYAIAMAKRLIIAEKPSVAADIARTLGGLARHDEYFEGDRYVLSSAVGHLLEIGMPEEEEVKRGKWTFTHLPAIPSKFALRPLEKAEPRLRLLLKLIKRKDVVELINACDAGREGELIFRSIVQSARTTKPIKRLWLQSMTPGGIRESFAALRSDEAMRPLADAAVCRSESDWLVGINGTRAMTAFNSKSGGFQLTTVGRVQTPTLAILVEREETIRAFRPRDFWEVLATFRAAGGAYEGRWFDEKFRKQDDADARAERLWGEAKAREIAAKCDGKPGTVSEESKPSTQSSPLLY